jgi:hypothetical protein
MKKSTLITTIAMIVVVVVALSTATYAWFSAATTTSASDEITTVAAADWIIMGGKVTHNDGTDSITFSSSNSIQLDMLDGLRSPAAVISAKYPTTAAINPTFEPVAFYEATQDGTGLADTAKAKTTPTIDVKTDDGVQSAANYVRIIRSGSESSTLVLTITVLTEGQNDSDFYASNGFVTYIGWTNASGNGSANTAYYYGTVSNSSTGSGDDVYYEATRTGKATASGVTYTGFTEVDLLNEGMQAGTASNAKAGYKNAATDNVTIGGVVINQGYYYQMKVVIADADHKMAKNSAVNIAFFAWFDGWAVDNSGSNSHASVYYEFGAN